MRANPKFSTLTVAVSGTCGELVQGWSAAWNEPVLVSCPIARYNQISLYLRNDSQIIITEPESSKARQAAHLILKELNRPEVGVHISWEQRLPTGRGMASSTADITGVMIGIAKLLNVPLSQSQLARLVCQIEPSDSTIFSGLTMFGYRGTARFQRLGYVPPLLVLMLDPGLTIDTLTYNTQLNLTTLQKLAPTTQTALDLLRQGLNHHDPALIGTAATLSAISYQAIHPNPLLPTAQRWAKETQALGLVRAHSGGLIGLLYPTNTDMISKAIWIKNRFEGPIFQTYLTNDNCLVSLSSPTPDLFFKPSPRLLKL